MSVTSFLSSFFSPLNADAPESKEEEEKPEETSEEAEPEAEAEEEEEEPEDAAPAIREECEATTKCAPLVKHFQHCQEKVHAGEGFKHEDCVEELMMHCVDACAAPTLFSKLK
ncbi:hypothetical protein JAAARDRAFT_59531 [Jaapia argillacea MUCL 33604]|uniref:Ubiquinol-cytochrome C reductase hinge domain-containing protein n=1 Tax=Jaapia argillacea MUCL 33604 TaxID=933084 RepID=A0A067PMW1_9AGAM|nr:hypothetical protein JAAARDRAFT_59531 [Jaapia argillacea MUCL 33604]